MSDRERILKALRGGPVTSIQMRTQGLTGNPSQRIAELRDRGHNIRATNHQVPRSHKHFTEYRLVR